MLRKLNPFFFFLFIPFIVYLSLIKGQIFAQLSNIYGRKQYIAFA